MKKTKNPNSSPSAELVSQSDDLLTLILLRLPLRSVARFKSVSKQWLSLITDTPQFYLPKPLKALVYLSHGNHMPRMFPLDTMTTQTSVALQETSLLKCDSTYVITHSSNGLSLSYISDFMTETLRYRFTFYISNPVTNLYTALPCQYPRPSFHPMAAFLAFDPSVASSHYTVVCFCISGLSGRFIMIYSSQEGCWRLSPAPFLGDHHGDGFSRGGSIYYLTLMSYNDNKLELHRFDVSQEKIVQVTCPSEEEEEHVLYLGMWRSRLQLVCCVYYGDCEYDVQELKVYSAEEGSEEWSLDVRCDLRAEYCRFKVVPTITVDSWLDPWRFRMFDVYKVVFFDPEERCLYFQVGKVVARYDFRARTVVKVFDHKDIRPTTRFYQPMEILFSAGLTQSGPLLNGLDTR